MGKVRKEKLKMKKKGWKREGNEEKTERKGKLTLRSAVRSQNQIFHFPHPCKR